MCSLEIARLSLAGLGTGLLPFTYVALILSFLLRFTKGFAGRIQLWVWANVAVFIMLGISNAVKVSQEVKEGTGRRKETKYPVADQVTDVAVMIALYSVLAILDLGLHFGNE